MKNKSYSELLLDPRWQKKRLQILQRDDFKCKICGEFMETLHVHHLKYTKVPWDVEDKHLISLCTHCHNWIHSFKEIEIIDEGFLSVYDFIWLNPFAIMNCVSHLENHKGCWIIEFNNKANPYNIISITRELYEFVDNVDCTIKLRQRRRNDPARYDDIDIFDML